MSLRQLLKEDVERLRQQLDDLLDSEDGFVILVDGQRAISYANGFGLSGSQLEHVAVEIERVIRSVAGPVMRVNGRKVDERLIDSDSGPAVRRHRHERPGAVLQLAQRSSSARSRLA